MSNTTDTNKHYAIINGVQPIQYIEQVLNKLDNADGFECACIKDIIKYASRYGNKDSKTKESAKILDYAIWLYCHSRGENVDPNINHVCIDQAILDKIIQE